MNFLQELARFPTRFDFHQALRRLENVFKDNPRWGTAARPSEESVRFGQDPTLAFGSAMLAGFRAPSEDQPGKLAVVFFGMFGSQGPLPLHLTEYARDRIRHVGDHSFAAFANLFNHRMIALFHRAWAAAQPTASFDRPETDRFRSYVASLFGYDFAPHSLGGTNAFAKLQYAGHLAGLSRSAAGLEALLADYFEAPVEIEQFIGQWLDIPEAYRFALGVSAQVSTLGRTAVLGQRVWRCDQKFRVVLGPLTRAQFDRLLPGGSALSELRDLVRSYTCDEFDWDARLILAAQESDQARLADGSRLGWNARLGARPLGNTEHIIVHPTSGRTERRNAA